MCRFDFIVKQNDLIILFHKANFVLSGLYNLEFFFVYARSNQSIRVSNKWWYLFAGIYVVIIH